MKRLTLLPALLVAAALPARGAASVNQPTAADPTAAWLDSQCRIWGADPSNPWALAHGVETYGAQFKAADGRLAVDVMVDDFLEKRTNGEWFFPTTKNGVPVDPHRDHQVATLVRAGLPYTRTFSPKSAPGEKVALGDLVEQLRKKLDPTAPDLMREGAWTIEALAKVSTGKQASWKNAAGKPVSMAQVMDRAASWITEQHQFLDDARKQGVPMVQKRKQFIWSLPCGGFHHINAAWSWNDSAFRKRHHRDLDTLVQVLLYRLDAESKVYDAALAQAPQYKLQLNVQQLKFYGHWLETVAHLREDGLWPKTMRANAAVARARDRLSQAVASLRDAGVSNRMTELKTAMPQIYLDLIGDSCHALVGWRKAK